MSDNTVFAQLDVDLGDDKVDQIAHQMGITSRLTGNPAEAIGGLTYGVTPLEMADAYATLANGGQHVPATILNHVVFPDGSSINLGAPKKTRVFTDGEAYAATQVLKGVITSGTGTAAGYGCPAAGKTGTAENYENAWFVGYTPQLSTAVWVGYPQGNIPMANGFGGTLAAPIWHDFMSSASNGYCGDFTQPNTPFQGTAFTGPYSSGGGSSSSGGSGSGGGYNYNGSGSGSNNGGATGGGTGGGGGGTSSPYNNPALYAQPPQPPAAPANTGGTTGGRTGGAPTGGGGAGVTHGGGATAPLSAGAGPTTVGRMPKEEKVELEGEVVEALPNAMFRVKLDNMDRTVLGHVAGQDAPLPHPHPAGRPRSRRALALRPRPRPDRLPPSLSSRCSSSCERSLVIDCDRG